MSKKNIYDFGITISKENIKNIFPEYFLSKKEYPSRNKNTGKREYPLTTKIYLSSIFDVVKLMQHVFTKSRLLNRCIPFSKEVKPTSNISQTIHHSCS